MAFPQVAAVNGGNNNSDSTEHTVNLPSGIQVGDLLLVFFVSDSYPTETFPEGWTELFDMWNGTTVRFWCYYRVADGTEGSSITVQTSTEQRTAHTSYRITDYTGTPEASSSTGDESANPDPASLSPSWGAEDTLWLGACGYDDGRQEITAYPANYTDGRNDFADHVAGCGLGTARRELNAASEDPGAFTLEFSNKKWIAYTVAVQPGVGPQYKKLAYTSEPPTPNAWNQLKQEAGTGWKKLLFEGE